MGIRMDVRRLFRKKAAAVVPRQGDLCLDLGVPMGVERRGIQFRNLFRNLAGSGRPAP